MTDEPDGQPFPRRRVALFRVLVVVASVLVLGLPLLGTSMAGRPRLFDAGGLSMLALLGVSIVASVGLGLLGIPAVRGHRGALGAITVIPVAAPLLTLVGVSLLAVVLGPSAASDDPVQTMSRLSRGTADLDALYIYGSYIGAAAFAAEAVALLSAAASVDGDAFGPAARRVFAVGAVSSVVVLVVHLAWWRGALVVGASFAILTTLSTLAARNADFIRAQPDDVEAHGWLAAVLGAAIAVGVGVVLFDFATMMLAERGSLVALSSESALAPKLAILQPLAQSHRAAVFCMALDGALAFTTAAMPFFAVRRRPQPLLTSLAFGSALATAGLLLLSRHQVRQVVEHAAHSSEAARAKLPAEPTSAYQHGEAAIVILDLHPDPLPTWRSLSWFDRELGIYADGDTPWPTVMAATAQALRDRNRWFPHHGANTSPPDLSIRLHERGAPDVGWYAAFLAGTEPSLRITLAYYGLDKGPDVLRDIPPSATLSDVVAEYTRRAAGRAELPHVAVELPKDF